MSSLTNPSNSPTFYELPAVSSPNDSSTDSSDKNWYLLAQIKENMTITKPTLIVTDRTGVDFALLFEDNINLKELGFRKGYTLAVPNARRTDREGEGKKAVVRVPASRSGDVKVREAWPYFVLPLITFSPSSIHPELEA
ncbi:hypothetical protein HD806DRAFT_443117 [Xylariaceae sp. AK1471]|nr:hypothetical protein HD806DRAFT_443117 [Xylariaceae sp. AK1471]